MAEVKVEKRLSEMDEEERAKLKVVLEEVAEEVLKEEASGYWDEGYRVSIDVHVDEEIVIRGEVSIRLWLNDYLENLAQNLAWQSEDEEIDWDEVVQEEIDELNREYAVYVDLALKTKASFFSVEMEAGPLELDEVNEYAGLWFRIVIQPPDLNFPVEMLIAEFKELFSIICKAITLP